jgi:hypothetical protein
LELFEKKSVTDFQQKLFISDWQYLTENCMRTLQMSEKKNNSVARVCERTIPTERPSLVGEVGANFCG